jgi:hypothetical protein
MKRIIDLVRSDNGRPGRSSEWRRLGRQICTPAGICFVPGLIAILLSIPRDSLAIDWEKLVMPGPLVEAHAKYESDCSSCHTAFDVAAQRQLCLDCHKDVAADMTDELSSGKGFHGRNTLASSGQCRSCHTDHTGRGANIRGLSEATFDHAETDYPLLGAHQSTTCAECHLADVRRRDAPSACVDCHRDDDAHDGALSTKCGDCHGEANWHTTRFDHDKTNHPLVGAHQSASCVGCHVGARYKDTPTDCVTCHSIDDAHTGRFGDGCADCHTPKSWRQEGFDHEKKSGFPLHGAHADASCVTCHRQPPGKRKLPENCSGCHASEDVHAGRFGVECGDCHRPQKWAEIHFDHGKRTDFTLRGAHRDASCVSCHSGPRKSKKMDSSCISCHKRDDVHLENLGRDCADCHDEKSFSGRVAFDHELTSFPLLGLHAMVTCESCHSSHTFQHEDLACQSCHSADDVHKKTLGTNCESCHNPNGWDVWRFDHGQRTSFALEGAHENLECSACHRQPMTRGLQTAKSCSGCHSSDDAHRGGFGRNCNGCHTFKAWKPASLGRSRGARQ